MKAIEKISQDLFDALKTPFVNNLSMGDEESLGVTEPEKARKFAFNFTLGDLVLGTVQITLNSNDQSLEVMFDHDLLDKLEHTETPERQARAKRVWFRFLRKMRKFATTNNLMTFNINNDTQDHLNKKDAEMYSVDELKESKMSKLAGSTKSSYQRVGENRIIIRHVGPIDEEKMGSRTRNIKAIYIENASGERFLVKENSLIGARILAHHMSSGGNLMDDFSNHLYTMIREMRDLKSFVLASRNKVFESDDANQMVQAATEYYKALRETVRSLTTGRGYSRYLESFNPETEQTNIDAEALKEKFVIRTFNEKFEAALPHIAKAYQKKIQEQNALYGAAQNYIDGDAKFGLTESDVELYKSMKFESGQALSKKVLEHISSILQNTDAKLAKFASESAEKFGLITETPETHTWLHQDLAMNLVKGFMSEMNNISEQAKNPYAIGMAQAMKATGDNPPLKKSTIKKAHHIANVIKKEVKEKAQGVAEGSEESLHMGDPVIITGDVQFKGKTGDIAGFGQDNRFVIVHLYNHGKHSFQRSDVSYNDYADSDDEQEYQQGIAEGSYQHHVVSKLEGNVLASYKTKEEAHKNAYGNPVVSGSLETIGDRKYVREPGIAEAGPFSYGARKPRQGSVADLAAKKRKEQEKGKQPIEPKDQMVGTAKVVKGVAEVSFNEFAPPGGGDGDDGFSDETLKRLAAQWYNGDEDPKVEQTLMAAGWEIGQDEGYDDEPGVFVVQAGDINGKSYMSWPADELRGLAEGSDPSGLYHAGRTMNKVWRITAEVEGKTKRFRVNAQSSRVAQEKFMKRYPSAHLHNIEDLTQMYEQGVAEGYQDDSKEREENLRYSRSRNPVADAIRKKLNPNQKEQNKEQGVAEGSKEKDPVWNKGTPMPKDYTCPCGIHVHPSVKKPGAIHAKDCPYAKKQGVAEGSNDKQWYDNIDDWHRAVDQIEYDRFESTTGQAFNGNELVAKWDAGLFPLGPDGDKHWSNPRGWVKIKQGVAEDNLNELSMDDIAKLQKDAEDYATKNIAKASDARIAQKTQTIQSQNKPRPNALEIPGVAEEKTVTRDKQGKVTGWSDDTDWHKANPKKQPSGKAANLAGQALKQTQKMADEEPKISESKATINDKMFTDTLAMYKKYSGI